MHASLLFRAGAVLSGTGDDPECAAGPNARSPVDGFCNFFVAVSSLVKETKTALDESRTLMLGSQILFGFQLEAPFQNGFDKLSAPEQSLTVALLPIMVGVIGLLVMPSAWHRIVEQGNASVRLNHFITHIASLTVPLFALVLALDLFLAGLRIAGLATAIVFGALSFVFTLVVCGARWVGRPSKRISNMAPEPTPLDAKIEYVLTESRVILPGAQALLGFQLIIVLTEAFSKLAFEQRVLHGVAILLVVLATALLMAPAARHRLVHEGTNSNEFHASASRYLLSATIILAAGMAVDIEVIAMKVTGSLPIAIGLAVLSGVTLFALWHVWPLLERRRQRFSRTSSARRAVDSAASKAKS